MLPPPVRHVPWERRSIAFYKTWVDALERDVADATARGDVGRLLALAREGQHIQADIATHLLLDRLQSARP